MQESKHAASVAIQARGEELMCIGDEIRDNPELNHEEHKAHAILTSYLSEKGFSVERSYTGLETAFRAQFGEGEPKIGILCEFDALAEIGHGCGHNLIAELGVKAGVGLKADLESTDLRGTVVVLGTPGKESGGGKRTEHSMTLTWL